MQRLNEIPNPNVDYKDTLNKGGIVVEGWDLATDEDGFIKAPPHLADQLASHGFVRAVRPPKAVKR